MAQRVQIVLEDDFDGGPGDETVTFGLDGVEYVIDLSAGNARKLREALSPWIANARKIGGRRRSAPAGTSGSDAAAIRTWAQENGIEVNARGRVPAEVREAYAKSRR